MVSSIASRYFFVSYSSVSCSLPRIPVVSLCLLTKKDAGASVTMDRIACRSWLALSYAACVRARAAAVPPPFDPVVGRVRPSISSNISGRVRLITVKAFPYQSSPNNKGSIPLNFLEALHDVKDVAIGVRHRCHMYSRDVSSPARIVRTVVKHARLCR